MKETERPTAERIARTALRLLEEGGPEAVTMRRVASEVGVTPMAIYYHYPSREALLRAVTEAEFGQLREALEAARERGLRGAELVAEMALGYVDYALARPRVLEYVFASPRDDARQYPADFRARQSPTLTLIADEIRAVMEAGEWKPDDEWAVALEIWALVHGYAVFYLGGRIGLNAVEFRALVKSGIGRMIDGLRA